MSFSAVMILGQWAICICCIKLDASQQIKKYITLYITNDTACYSLTSCPGCYSNILDTSDKYLIVT